MDNPMQVECLSCGQTREIASREGHVVDSSDCHRCGYLGWAPAGELTEPVRRALRDRPLSRRRRASLRVAA
jgi:hypothetical protein